MDVSRLVDYFEHFPRLLHVCIGENGPVAYTTQNRASNTYALDQRGLKLATTFGIKVGSEM